MKNFVFIFVVIYLYENLYRIFVVYIDMVYMQILIQRLLIILIYFVFVFGGVFYVCDIFMVVRNILYFFFIIKYYIIGRFDVFDFCYKCKVIIILSDFKQIKINRFIERIYIYYILNVYFIFIIINMYDKILVKKKKKF